MTWRFGPEMAKGNNLACTWFAGAISFFWLLRTFLQVAYYSSSHWRGHMGRTFIHIACLIIYGVMGAIYFVAILKRIGTS